VPARRHQRAPVPGALERDRDGPALARLQLGERQLELALDEAADVEAPRRRVDLRDVEVDQQVVQTDRGNRLPEDLQRQRVIPGGELELLERDAGCRGDVDTRNSSTVRWPGQGG
jgi:hypothetical protein